MGRFTASERRIVRDHRTPESVQRWLRSLAYHREPVSTMRSFRGVARHRTAHCLEGALAAATILECHGYPPLLLDLESADLLDHVVFVFRRRARWGAVGSSRDVGLHGRRPAYRTIRALARSYYEPYVNDRGARIRAFALADLRALGGYDWRLSDRSVWRVERFLIGLAHTPLSSPDRHYRRLRARYCRYIASHPPTGTPFTRARRNWM